MSGESDENFEGVTKFFPRRMKAPTFYHLTKTFTRFFLSPTETSKPILYTSTKKQIQIFTPWIKELSALKPRITKSFFPDQI